jgi:dTDP-4-amino-4,6-dideoxygalactose transaminase
MYLVTKPLLPDLDRYRHYLERAHEKVWLTNFGPLHEELTERLKAYLGVEHLLLVTNGTLALHVAYRALGLKGKVLTTPFSFVATTSTLAWEGLEPSFVDIDAESLNLDPAELERAEPGSAVVAVHVYGNPCEVQSIERIARGRQIPVIYDAAHAFGSEFDGKSVLQWGDASTMSFHATKIFHTVEGGAIVFKDEAHYAAARALINFGLGAGETIGVAGTNAKFSDYHAAAGLTLLDIIDQIVSHRAELVETYRRSLDGWVEFQLWNSRGRNNGAYMPVLLRDEAQCLALKERLEGEGIQTRRYFYPSLNTLGYVTGDSTCPVSERAASRVLCLPLYADLAVHEAQAIAERVKAALQ